MGESIFFNKKQYFWVREALEIAETLAEDYFRVDLGDYERFPYDLQTLANLRVLEKTQRALAQVCKYEYYKRESFSKFKGREFYRICLQDDKILNTVQTESSSLLRPLLLCIVTHELIHVIRFSLDPKKFYLKLQEKRMEESDVHQTTYELLKYLKDPQVGFFLDLYRPRREEGGLDSKGPALDNI
ncbi:MAG: hypothetical protein HY882_10975 [Deltaproteobacteria bacterium]|nr:hypothetical protein [Deltaproteobacteria bacterium]